MPGWVRGGLRRAQRVTPRDTRCPSSPHESPRASEELAVPRTREAVSVPTQTGRLSPSPGALQWEGCLGGRVPGD